MVLEIIALVLCLWLAVKLRQRQLADEEKPAPWTLAKRSLRWGAVAVTVPMLSFFGVVRFMHGLGIPSIFSLVLAMGVTALVMFGAEVEISGNILLDCLLVSASLVGTIFTVVNGVPVALALLNMANLCRWALLCVGAAIFVRVTLWVIKGD